MEDGSNFDMSPEEERAYEEWLIARYELFNDER